MRSYLKFLSRNKLYFAIEFIGLAVSLAFVILMGSYVRQQTRLAKGAPEWKNIYVLGTSQNNVEMAPRTGLAELLKDEVPGIEKASVYNYKGCTGTVGEQSIGSGTNWISVNPDFLDMFPIRWLSGDVSSVLASNTVAISRRYAEKFFPDGNYLGKTWTNSDDESFTIVALFEDFGARIFRAESLAFLNVQTNPELEDGSYGGVSILIESREDEAKLGADIDATLEAKRLPMFDRDESRAMKNASIERLDRMYFSDLNGGNHAYMKGNRSLLWMLSAVVLLLLLSALFNYINLSCALTGRRMKEMGMRAALGASRAQIVWKYIQESLLFTAVSTVVAILLAYAFTPVFAHYIDAKVSNSSQALSVPFGWDWDFGMVAGVVGIALLTGLLAGWIPSRIASRFDLIQVLGGSYRTTSKRILSRVFIVFQTALSIALVALALVMERQYSHMVNRPLGADLDGLYYFFGAGHQDELKALPFVTEAGLTGGYPGAPAMTLGSKNGDDVINVAVIFCDRDAFEMYHFEVLEDFHVPAGKGFWLSEAAYHAFCPDPSQKPALPSNLQLLGESTVAGVVRDFALSDAAHVPNDVLGLVWVGDSSSILYAQALRISGDRDEAEKELKKLYRKISLEELGHEGYPQMNGFMKDKLDEKLGEAENYMRLIELFMLLSVLVALMGLLAVSALFAAERTHDIAVRKVYGSTVWMETWSSVRSYMVLVVIAALIAIPVAVWLCARYLEQFSFRISDYGWIFAVDVALVLVFSFLSVLWQNLKSARTNPATELKKE